MKGLLVRLRTERTEDHGISTALETSAIEKPWLLWAVSKKDMIAR